MNNKTRSILKAIAVILVLVAIIVHQGWIIIPAVSGYNFWLVVVAFGIMLLVSK